MREEKTASGIVLKAIAFRDYDQILTLYSKELGRVKFCIPSALRQTKNKGVKTAPLNEIELVYTEQKGELFKGKDPFLLNAHLKIRKHLSTLQCACDMVEAIESSQPLFLPNPTLYDLFSMLLKALQDAIDPFTLAAAFRLKILKIDGWFNLKDLHGESSLLMQHLANEKSLKNLLSIRTGPDFLAITKALMESLIKT